MNERLTENPYEGLTEEQIKMCQEYEKDNPEVKIPYEKRRNPEKEIAEFENLIKNFEASHNLAELHAIIELSPEDAPNHPKREAARNDLVSIVSLLKILKEETSIKEENYETLKAEYRRLSQAVGIINGHIPARPNDVYFTS